MYKFLVQPSFSGSWSLLHSLHDDRQANSWIRTCLVSVPGFAGLKKATGNVANSSLVLTIHPSTWGWKTIVWKVWSFCLKLVHSAFFNKILRPNHLAKSAVLVASPRCRCFFFAEEVCTWWPLIHDQPGMVRVGSTGWIPFMKFWTFNRFSDRFTGSTNKLTCAPFLELQLSRVKKTEMKYLESLDAFPKFGTLILWLDLDPLVLEVIWMLEWWQDTHHSRTSAPSSLHHTKTQWNCAHSQILSSHILSVEGYATIRLRLCLNHKLDVRQKMMDWDFHGRKSDPLNNSIPKSKQSKQFCSQFKPNSFFATMRVFFFRLFLSFFRLFIFCSYIEMVCKRWKCCCFWQDELWDIMYCDSIHPHGLPEAHFIAASQIHDIEDQGREPLDDGMRLMKPQPRVLGSVEEDEFWRRKVCFIFVWVSKWYSSIVYGFSSTSKRASVRTLPQLKALVTFCLFGRSEIHTWCALLMLCAWIILCCPQVWRETDWGWRMKNVRSYEFGVEI